MALNLKKLNYKTEWVEYPDIEALYQRLGAPPNEQNPDGGRGPCTLPVIFDPSTKAVVTDSSTIIKYLDTTYPDTPVLFPPGTDAFQKAFSSIIWTSVLPPLLFIVIGRVCSILNPPSAAYFKRTREAAFGKKLEEIGDERHWEQVERGLEAIGAYLNANGDGKDMLLMGDRITYSDIYIAAIFRWVKMVVGEESEDWKRLMYMHNGKWVRFIAQFSDYEFVDV